MMLTSTNDRIFNYLGFALRQIIIWRLFILLIWLSLFMTCSVTYACRRFVGFPIWKLFPKSKKLENIDLHPRKKLQFWNENDWNFLHKKKKKKKKKKKLFFQAFNCHQILFRLSDVTAVHRHSVQRLQPERHWPYIPNFCKVTLKRPPFWIYHLRGNNWGNDTQARSSDAKSQLGVFSRSLGRKYDPPTFCFSAATSFWSTPDSGSGLDKSEWWRTGKSGDDSRIQTDGFESGRMLQSYKSWCDGILLRGN